MNKNNGVAYGVGGMILGLILGVMFSPVWQSGGMMSGQKLSNSNQMTGNIDKHFIEQMIPHHDGAIAMANLALEKAKRQEIKTLATAIIAAQTTEIQDMSGWYQNWFGTVVPKTNTGMMGGGMMSQKGMYMGGQEDMTALESAADFDKAFIEGMIPHHQMAIMMANMLQSGTSRPEMQRLAEGIVSSQSKEIQQMQGWYAQWYR